MLASTAGAGEWLVRQQKTSSPRSGHEILQPYPQFLTKIASIVGFYLNIWHNGSRQSPGCLRRRTRGARLQLRKNLFSSDSAT
jgi:hypothetical protein